MEMEDVTELKSGVFRIMTKDRQTDWFMRIIPSGEEKTCKGFVSLFLYKDGICEVCSSRPFYVVIGLSSDIIRYL